MSDTNVSRQSIPDARTGLRGRYAQLESLPESKERRHQAERLHSISQGISILAIFGGLLVGLLAVFTTILEAIGHSGLLSTGALLGGITLLVLLPVAGLVSVADNFNLRFARVYPGVTEAEIASIIANMEANEREDPLRAPEDKILARERIIAANTRPARATVLRETLKGGIATILIPALLSLPLLAVAFGLIVAPLAWLIMGAYVLLWIAGCFFAFALTFGAN